MADRFLKNYNKMSRNLFVLKIIRRLSENVPAMNIKHNEEERKMGPQQRMLIINVFFFPLKPVLALKQTRTNIID